MLKRFNEKVNVILEKTNPDKVSVDRGNSATGSFVAFIGPHKWTFMDGSVVKDKKGNFVWGSVRCGRIQKYNNQDCPFSYLPQSIKDEILRQVNFNWN